MGPRTIWVTGTDTGVGKTHVTVELVTWLRRRSVDAIALKPVETGWQGGESDAQRLAEASGRPLQHTIWQKFRAPLAPAVAAEQEGRRIDRSDLQPWIERSAAGRRVCFVEGAGGWMVPFGSDWMFCDLAASTGAPVLVVARATLGTINHSLLTANAVARTNPVVALVLSRHPGTPSDVARRNQEQIRRHTSVEVKIVPDELPELVAMFDGGRRTPDATKVPSAT